MKERIKLILIILLVLGLMLISLIKKRAKPILIVLLALGLLLVPMSGCGYSGGGNVGENVGLVFVNDSDITIVTVVADFASSQEGSRHADNSPLRRGESLGFQAGEYPVTVLVYDRSVGSVEKHELARIVIRNAPPEGKRWYVTARDAAGGLMLSAGTQWPEGV